MTNLTCPKCENALEVDQEWRLINIYKLGTVATNIQGDYAHKECVDR